MPLTSKGAKIMTAMKKEYGSDDKADEVFYAARNKGTISGVEAQHKAMCEEFGRIRRAKGGKR